MATPPEGCPMHVANQNATPPVSKQQEEMNSIPSECPMSNNQQRMAPPSECPMSNNQQVAPPSECPMHQDNVMKTQGCGQDDINPLNMMMPPNQQPSPGQPFPLPTERVTSSIPKGGDKASEGNWVYPSPQMFWNAMIRKGWRPEEEGYLEPSDMSHIIAMHNKNNEGAWEEILQWERFHDRNCDQPKLVSFKGRAKDYSPRAQFRKLLGYELPYDRHDWIVERNGQPVRYIIDYYDVDDNGEKYKTGDFTHMDVRPALDSFSAAMDRSRAFMFRWTAPLFQKLIPDSWRPAAAETEEASS